MLFPAHIILLFPPTCTAEPCPLSHLRCALSAGAIAGIVVAGVIIVIAALTAAVILVGVVIRRGTQWSCALNTIKA